MRIINTGNTYRTYDDSLKTFEKLPALTYIVRFSQMSGFYLEKYADIEIKEKVYGVHTEKIDKVLRAFSKTQKNLGVILSGDKGIGKSLFAKILSVAAIEKGMPVIIVDQYIPGIASFLEEIEQEVVVLFDEFDKTFGGVKAQDGMADPQTEMLALFDGISQGKKLFVITCNNLNSLSDYLVNRPGRFHYHFRFEYPSDEEISEYMKDKIEEKYYGEIKKVILFAHKVYLNYDCLRAIAFELNFGLSFEEAIRDLNIINLNKLTYKAVLRLKDGAEAETRIVVDLFDKDTNLESYFYINDVDVEAGCKVKDCEFDPIKNIIYVSGENIKLSDSGYGDEEDKKKIKEMQPAYMILEREKAKNLHYIV